MSSVSRQSPEPGSALIEIGESAAKLPADDSRTDPL
jgi:hypothetical protein